LREGVNMSEPPNFILVANKGNKKPLPSIPRPPCIDELLHLFETHCVVGCCDWDALNLSDEYFCHLVKSGQSTADGIHQVLLRVLDWSKQLKEPGIIEVDEWYFDPERAKQEMHDAVQRLDRIRGDILGDTP